jgi:hypothetical protein
MEDKRNLHLRMQELCECYASTDPLKEMSVLPGDQDKEEAALKWLALATLHALTSGAKSITLTVSPGGEAVVTAKYREAVLPSPGGEVGAGIVRAMRQINHFEGPKAKGPLALGLKNDSLEISVKVASDEGREELTLKFPE